GGAASSRPASGARKRPAAFLRKVLLFIGHPLSVHEFRRGEQQHVPLLRRGGIVERRARRPGQRLLHRLVVEGVGELGKRRALRRLRPLRPEKSRGRSEEHTSELQSLAYLVCRLLLEKKKKNKTYQHKVANYVELSI